MSLPWIVAILIGCLLPVYYVYRPLRARHVWQAWADDEGFDFEQFGWLEDFQMKGKFRGHEVRMQTIQRGPGRRKMTYTTCTVPLPSSVPNELELRDRSKLARLGRVFDDTEFELDHPDFDRAFTVRTEPACEDDIRTYLEQTEVVEALLAVQEVAQAVYVSGQSLRLEHRGLVASRSTIEQYLNALVTCVEALDAVDP